MQLCVKKNIIYVFLLANKLHYMYSLCYLFTTCTVYAIFKWFLLQFPKMLFLPWRILVNQFNFCPTAFRRAILSIPLMKRWASF